MNDQANPVPQKNTPSAADPMKAMADAERQEDQHLNNDLTELGQSMLPNTAASSLSAAERDRAARIAIGAGGAAVAATAGIAAADSLLRERAQAAAANHPGAVPPVTGAPAAPAAAPTPPATTPERPMSQLAGTEHAQTTNTHPHLATTTAPVPVAASSTPAHTPTITPSAASPNLVGDASDSPVITATDATPHRSLAEAAGATTPAEATGFTPAESIPGYHPATAPLGMNTEMTLTGAPKPTGSSGGNTDIGPNVLPSTVTDTDNTQQPHVQGFIAGDPNAAPAGAGTGGGGTKTEDELWGDASPATSVSHPAAPVVAAAGDAGGAVADAEPAAHSAAGGPIIAPADDSEPEWVAALRQRDAQEAARHPQPAEAAHPASETATAPDVTGATTAPTTAVEAVTTPTIDHPATADATPAPTATPGATDIIPTGDAFDGPALVSDAAPQQPGDTTAVTGDAAAPAGTEGIAATHPSPDAMSADAPPVSDPAVMSDLTTAIPAAGEPTTGAAPSGAATSATTDGMEAATPAPAVAPSAMNDLDDLPESVRARLADNPDLLHGLDDARSAYLRHVADVIRQVDPAAADDYIESHGLAPVDHPTHEPGTPAPIAEPDTVEMGDGSHHAAPDIAASTGHEDTMFAAPGTMEHPIGEDDLTPPPSDAGGHPLDTTHPHTPVAPDSGDDLMPPIAPLPEPHIGDPSHDVHPTDDGMAGIVGDDTSYAGATGDVHDAAHDVAHPAWVDPQMGEEATNEEPHHGMSFAESGGQMETAHEMPAPEPYHDPVPDTTNHDPLHELPSDPTPEPEPGHETDPTHGAFDASDGHVHL